MINVRKMPRFCRLDFWWVFVHLPKNSTPLTAIAMLWGFSSCNGLYYKIELQRNNRPPVKKVCSAGCFLAVNIPDSEVSN